MDQPPPKESRAPINLRIKFRSESIDQFIDRYSIDVSRGGIFIRTREPLAVGTQLKFDFQLQDSSPLMTGEGTVVWIREYDPNRTGITPGMGVRFDKLTTASQPVLEKILAEKGRRDQSGPQSGGIMSKVGAGMAVRRPSSTFTALDPRALGLVTGPGSETPAVGTQLPDGARRERHPSTPAGTPVAAASERTNQGGFAAPGGPGVPSPARPAAARARTPGGLPSLETPGSGRHGTPSEVPSLVSRLTAGRPGYEPPTSADIDKALDGLTGAPAGAKGAGAPASRAHDAPSEPTKTGDALADALAANAAADSAAPVAEIDGERTQATSPEDLAAMIGASVRPNPALERTAKDLEKPDEAALAAATAAIKTAAPTAPSLFLIKNEAPIKSDQKETREATAKAETPGKPEKDDRAANAAPGEKDEKAAKASSAVRRDELLPQEVTPQPTTIASSGQSATAAGSFTASKVNAAPSRSAPATAVPVSAPGSGTAKTRTARAGKKRSVAPFVVAGLIGAAAVVVAVVASQRGGDDHAQESFQQPKSEPAAPAKPDESTGVALPSNTNAVPAPAPNPTEATKSAEAPAAAPPPPAAAATEAPAPAPAAAAKEAAPAEAPAAQAPAQKARAAKPARAHQTVAVVGPPKRAASAAGEPSGESKKVAAEESSGTRPAVQRLLKITSTPAGAQVLIDGQSVGTTPFVAKEIDADAPHAVSIRLDGYESHEHMISGADWQKQKGNLEIAKVTVKLRKLPPAALDEPVKAEGAAAEPGKTDRPTEAKTGPAPVEKATEKAAAEPTAPPPSPTEPPKQKDEPATASPPVK